MRFAGDLKTSPKEAEPPSRLLHQAREDEIVVDWNKDGKVVCNVTNMSKEERELLMRRKKGKRKAEKDAVELIGE